MLNHRGLKLVFLPLPLYYLPYSESDSESDSEIDSESGSKFIRGIEETQSWKSFFDSVERKEDICCKKLIQLGKKIYVIFAIAQKWECNGYLIGQILGREICMDIHKKIKERQSILDLFAPWLYSCELEYVKKRGEMKYAKIFSFRDTRVEAFGWYRKKYTMAEMQQHIRKELMKVLEI